MILRELVEALVDADVECGATTPVIVKDEDQVMYSVQRVEVEETLQDGEGHDISTGPTIWLHVEEM